MKKMLLVLVTIALIVPVAVLAAQHQAGKAKTVDELAKMYDVSSCKECHAKVFEEWSQSIHSRSLVGTGRTMATIRNAITDGMMKEWKKSGVKEVKDIRVEHMMSCTKCHLPQLQDATDEVAQQIAKAVLDGDEETLNKVSINCIVCHNMKAIVHKWVDGEPEKGAVYGKLEGPHPDKNYPAMKTSLIRQEAIFCGQCHGLGPNFELKNPTQCATLYGSYLHNYVPESGLEAQKCHECHKNKKDRGHRFPAYRDPEMLKEAVNVEVQTKGYQLLYAAGQHIPLAGVVVTMTNNAGHRIPDG